MSAPLAASGNLLLVGVGGQGIILASELIADALLAAGFDVRKSEVHGMSQRGGRVESHVRYGSRVFSPLIPRGQVELLLGFELAETLRSLPWLAPGAQILAADTTILPYGSMVGAAPYPHDAADRIRAAGFPLTLVDAAAIAREAGEGKAANAALAGALSRFLPVPAGSWEAVLTRHVPPKALAGNLAAFRLGRGKA